MPLQEVRDFSKRGDALPIPNLIDVQIESLSNASSRRRSMPTKRKNDGLEALLREVFPIESYDGNLRLEYISYDLAEPRYTHRRVPRAAADLRHALPHPGALRPQGQGRGDGGFHLPRRNPHHDRRRRVHHQRRRARDRQPASPLAGRGLPRRSAGRRPPAARLPRHPRARLVDRMLGHQEGRAGRPHRPVEQDPRDDVPARAGREVFSTTESIIKEFYTIENGQGRPASARALRRRSDHRRRERRGAGQGRRADRRSAEQDPGLQAQERSRSSPRSPTR